MGELHLSEVINYDKDIRPYRFIKVYSGVGSGKSTFACRFITGCQKEGEEVPELTTLIVTSRRAKVEETLRDMGARVKKSVGAHGNLSAEVSETGEDRPVEYEKYVRVIASDDKFSSEYVTHNQSVVCTNAYIESHLKYCYIPTDPTTHLWNLFDVIIIDEVHSLITDATYQSAPFAVLELIKEYLHLCANAENPPKCKHLILMTGTPAPFENFIDVPVPKEISAEYSVFDECINVVPKTVEFVNSLSAKDCVEGILQFMREKAVYFTNHILDRESAKKKWSLGDDINIAVSFSDNGRRRALPKEEREYMKEVEEELEGGLLPDDIDLFVTTSRHKEGINIKNNDIAVMFVESHFSSDIIQMAGRMRNGLEKLFIVTDAKQLCNGVDAVDVEFTLDRIVKEGESPEACGEANGYLLTLCEKHTVTDLAFRKDRDWTIHTKYKDSIGEYIDYIESRFPYVQYSYIDNCFKFYTQKRDAEQLIFEENNNFTKAVIAGKDAVTALVRSWFPNANVVVNISSRQRGIQLLNDRIGETGQVELTEKEWESLFTELREVSGISGVYGKTFLANFGDYGITDRIRSKRGGTIGNRILYKGENPLVAGKRRSPSKKRALQKRRKS